MERRRKRRRRRWCGRSASRSSPSPPRILLLTTTPCRVVHVARPFVCCVCPRVLARWCRRQVAGGVSRLSSGEYSTTMISDTCGYVLCLLLLSLVPYIESGKCRRKSSLPARHRGALVVFFSFSPHVRPRDRLSASPRAQDVTRVSSWVCMRCVLRENSV